MTITDSDQARRASRLDRIYPNWRDAHSELTGRPLHRYVLVERATTSDTEHLSTHPLIDNALSNYNGRAHADHWDAHAIHDLDLAVTLRLRPVRHAVIDSIGPLTR